jgi:phosphoadenosine phosphosulfate reductase
MNAIELYARPSAQFESRLAHTRALLRAAATEFDGRIVQATSLGAEDMVLTDLIARDALPIAVATLDTGALHAQTLALVARIGARYGIAVEVWAPPAADVVQFVERHGADAMRRSVELRKACCALRKLGPLQRLLAGRSAWVTGLRREQSETRAEVPERETDAQQRVKLNALADWSWGDVWHYIATREVPYNPLHDQFMPSIGCAPCTRAIAVGEPFRAGRWWWESAGHKECGLHFGEGSHRASDVKAADAAGRSQDPGSEECGLHVAPAAATEAVT